jgi:hypothetical protein
MLLSGIVADVGRDAAVFLSMLGREVIGVVIEDGSGELAPWR